MAVVCPVERRAHSAVEMVRMALAHSGFYAEAIAGDGEWRSTPPVYRYTFPSL